MNKTLVDKLVELIHADIISLRLKPGQRLHIAQLAEQFHVGPGPIREALSRLLATELVVAMSQRGFRVSLISKMDLADVYQTRMHIEGIALTLAIEKGDDAWEAEMISSHYQLAKFEMEHIICNEEDYKEWERRHRAFNKALISACGLNHLLREQAHLFYLTERYRRQWLLAGIKNNRISYAEEQKKLMDAAIERNVDLVTKYLFQHYEKAIIIIESFFIEHKLFH